MNATLNRTGSAARSRPYPGASVPPLPVPEAPDTWRLDDGTVLAIRPAREDDGPIEQDLVRALSPRTKYYRFFQVIRELSPEMLAHLTHTDPVQEVTLLAFARQGGSDTLVGIAQYVANPYPESAEFAVVVADAWQGKGIGKRLIGNLMCIARAAGFGRLEGEVLAENEPMLRLLHGMGFDIRLDPETAAVMRIGKPLVPASDCKGDWRGLVPTALGPTPAGVWMK